ncbi:MAG: cobalt ABC transporter permease [Rhodospirillum sp.]|nr:cobalt ABC transporter permease [Rhodospirillum sp.]MCF8488171.1 cobalt ABC transporter permease [Rhodospirillum sp.]MCF8501928.1 cobalt ABC transporter permease [Rhodospirillum sp.]
MRRFFSILAGICLIFVLAVTPARAHKVIASAYASGQNLEGEVGFSNGEMAKDTLVEVFDPSGRKLGETQTDGEGFFSFTPTEAVDHLFVADLGAGHVARFTVPISDLPKSLTGGGKVPATATGAPLETPVASRGAIPSAEIAALVSEAVKQEVRPLRREITAYKEKHDIQSILGGLGYILGLVGVVFYLMARRRLSMAP